MSLFDDEPAFGTNTNGKPPLDLLSELEQNRSDEVRRQRQHFRLQVRLRVTLQPANASALLTLKMQGTTGDLSEGGCCVLFPMPVQVGDVYRLTFDRTQLDVPLVFARCLRCRLLREDAYEAGFRFFAPLTLPDHVPGAVATS